MEVQNIYRFDKEEKEKFTAISVNDLPDQLAPKTPEWFFRNAQYVFSFYNSATPNVNDPSTSGLVGDVEDNGSSGRQNNGNWESSYYSLPVNRMIRYLLYYLGEQPNLNYNFLTDGVGGESPVFWTKGKDIKIGIDNMRGAAQDALSGLKFGANPLSSEVVSKREKMYHQEMFKFLIKPFMEQILQNAIKTPQAAADFKTPESIKDWMDSKFKEHLSEVYVNIAKNNWTSQYWTEDGVTLFTYASVCGLAAVEHYMDNGYYKKMVHAPYNIIFDNRVDSDYNRYGRFVGAIQQMTLMEVFNRYPQLTKEDRKVLSEIAASREQMQQMNIGPVKFPWWNTTNDSNSTNKDVSFNVVRAYFIAPETINGEIIEELYSCEIIGNRFMVNFGKVNNVITDVNTPYRPMLPIQLWMPNMVMGRINSFVGRVTDLQDEYDLYRFKLRELIANSKGRKFIVFGEKLGGKNVKNMIQDWNVGPITVVSTSGVAGNYADSGPKMQTVDLTMDPNVIQLVAIREKVNQELYSYMSLNLAALGRQTKYIGQKTSLQNTENANKGTAVFFDDFMNYIQRNVRYGMNMKKNLYAEGLLKEEAQTVIGERGLKMLKMTKELYAEDFLIYLKLDDNVDEKLKEQLFELAKAYAQNSQDGYSLTTLYEILTASTSTKIKDIVKAKDDEILQRQKENMQAQMQMKQQTEQMKAQQEQALAMLDAQTKKNGQQLNFIAKKMKLDHEMAQAVPDALPVINSPDAAQSPQGIPPQQQNQQQSNPQQ